MAEIGIGLLGLGNVGLGVAHILETHQIEIEARLGARLVLRRIAVRDLRKARGISLDAGLLTDDFNQVIDDEGVDIVVELMGGQTHARDAIKRALHAGKPVVTANKTLLAYHGDELIELARERQLDVYFEAAVGGGLPIVRTLREALASDKISSLHGILNGTTNFVLGEMGEGGHELGEAISAAQAAGYAEADPSADVEGHDAAEKLSLLAAIAFGLRVSPKEISTRGILNLESRDLVEIRRMGYALKLVASGHRVASGQVALRVGPTLVPLSDPLASVQGADNAVAIQAEALGPSLLVGAGAGGLPTGSAVVADLIECARNLRLGTSGRVPAWSLTAPGTASAPGQELLPESEHRSSFYLRFEVEDRPGVLGRLATALGEEGVSVAAVTQREHRLPRSSPGSRREHPAETPVSILVITHPTTFGALEAATERIRKLDELREGGCQLPLLGVAQ